ncbi:MAG: hypothetical protein PHQ75_14120, partial [Thermoguttaceae bacterium]|nr:hypothetical protein [Thermoguttaceae bacterium]
MKTRLEVLIASTLFFLCLAGIVRADAPSITSWGSITQPAQGIFAGQIKGNLVYIGGFHWAPNASDADNNKVKQNPNDQYLRTIQILSRRSDGSVATTQSNTLLPEGAAFGTTVVMPNGLAILGGRNHSGPVSRCYHVHWSQDKQDLELESLPPLPFTIEKAAGDFHRGRIWLCGADPDGNSILLSLAAKTNAASSNSWKKHAPPPGMGRKDAAATVGNDSRGKALFLFGGILPDGTAAQPQVCVFHFDDETWTEPKIAFPPTFCVAGATLFRSGTIHLILTGGMDPKCQTPCAARTIWAYNTI